MKLRLVLIAAILLAITPIPAASALTNSAATTNCSATVKKKLLSNIKSQSQALEKKDYKTAIAFATAKFRAQVSLAQFTAIITQRYSFLGNAASFRIEDCQLIGTVIHSGVRVTDTANVSYYLFYVLQPQSKKEAIAPNKTGYGIAAAQLGEVQTQAIYQ